MLPAARDKGVSFVVGSALNAGFLSGAGRYNYGQTNTLIEQDKLAKRDSLRAIASRHGVDLLAAALQISLAPDVASALIVGAATPDHILADHAAMRAKIPPSFWDELQAANILHRDAAVPA